MQTQHYIYLHGFASSPNSTKALYFKQKFAGQNINLIMPDMNEDDFANLTLSRQINLVKEIISQLDGSISLIGSSMGGLTALLIAEELPQISQIVLLAPAFGMSEFWPTIVPPKQMQSWQESGETLIFHHAYACEVPLNYTFTQDLLTHDDKNFQRNLDVLICHGIHDKVVPIKYSREYTNTHPQSNLLELDDDHGLINSTDLIWKEIRQFCVI